MNILILTSGIFPHITLQYCDLILSTRFLVHVLCSCVSVSLTRHITPPCQRLHCHKAIRLAMLAEGLMEVFMHVSQLAGNNLHVMSGPRRQPTCWAAPWRSSPPPSSSTRLRARCPEPAPSVRRLRKVARETQVLHKPNITPLCSS